MKQYMTAEQLEEHIEFVNWAIVPVNLLTSELKEKFSCLPMIRNINYLEAVLNSVRVKKLEEYPDDLFFFINGIMYMNFNYKNNYLFCSVTDIWNLFNKNKVFSYEEIETIIKFTVEKKFTKLEVIPQKGFPPRFVSIETKIRKRKFKTIKINELCVKRTKKLNSVPAKK